MKLKERDTEIEQIRGSAQRDVAAMQKKLDDVRGLLSVCWSASPCPVQETCSD
jgi:hypothetical protein